MNRMNTLIRNEEGQGMTEYIIIVALIAIAAIGIITIFGQNIRALFSASAAALAGETDKNTADKGAVTTEKVNKKGLNNFSVNNDGTKG